MPKKAQKANQPLPKAFQPPKRLILFLGLFIPVALSYVLSVFAPYHFDDKKALITLTTLHRLSDFGAIFNFDPYLPRPLFHFYLALNWSLWNKQAWGFHLTNLMWHIAVVFLLWATLKRIVKNENDGEWIAYLAALLFGLSPVLTESVTYIWGASGVISAFFMLLSLYLYLIKSETPYKKILLTIASLISFVAALAAKETAAILPVLIAAVGLSDGASKNKAKTVLRAVPYFLIVAAILVWRRVTYGSVSFDVGGSYIGHLARQTRVLVGYLRLLIYPVNLSVVHYVPDSYPVYSVFFSAVVFAAILAGTIMAFKRYRTLWLSGVFFFAGLAPYYFIPLKDRMVERNLYVPAIGFALFISWALVNFGANRKKILAAGLAICFAALTFSRNVVWLHEYTLWKSACHAAPQDARPRMQLGALALVSGKTEIAERLLNQAITLDPKCSDAYNDLGVLFSRKGDMGRAEYEFARAIAANNDNVKARMNRIRAILKRGDVQTAQALLEKMVERSPRFVESRNILADIYRRDKRLDAAADLLSGTLRIDPANVEAMIGLSLLSMQKGDVDAALDLLNEALSVDPQNYIARRTMGMILASEREFAQAADEYEKAAQFAPYPDPDIFADWGLALTEAGQYERGRFVFGKEMELRPGDPRPFMRLGLLEEKAGNFLAAKLYYSKALSADADGKYKTEIEGSLLRLNNQAPQ